MTLQTPFIFRMKNNALKSISRGVSSHMAPSRLNSLVCSLQKDARGKRPDSTEAGMINIAFTLGGAL